VPDGMNAVIMKLLSKSPEDRYPDADALSEDLWRVRSGLPVGEGANEARTVEAPTNRLAPTARRAAPAPARPKRSRAPFVLAALLLLLGLAGVGLGLAQGPGSSNSIDVPSVEGLPEDEAVSRLESAGFRTEVRTDEGGGGEAGTVTDQSPPGGEQAREGSTVTLTVAASTVAVPDVVGQTLSEAEAALQGAGLAVGSTYDVQGDAAADVVLEQGVAAGTEVQPGTPVNLGISSGPAAPASASPDASPDASASQDPTSSPAPSDSSSDASADASASPEADPQSEEEAEAAAEAREEAQEAREEAQEAREEAAESEEAPKAKAPKAKGPKAAGGKGEAKGKK
jgi:eukaryotic-like serine/threonine-protein kinase